MYCVEQLRLFEISTIYIKLKTVHHVSGGTQASFWYLLKAEKDQRSETLVARTVAGQEQVPETLQGFLCVVHSAC